MVSILPLQECREIIERLLQAEFPKKKPPFLKIPDHPKGLELDGYNEKLRLAFEYDGEQHFNAVECWGGDESLQKQKERDTIKDELCFRWNVKLIRIPYNIDNKEEFISRILV